MNTARLVAKEISVNEMTLIADRWEYLDERQRLLDKLFADTITPTERERLEHVRWMLDQIEAALLRARSR
jgi:hypothetical protein